MSEIYYGTITTWSQKLNWKQCYLVGLDNKFTSKCTILENAAGPSKGDTKSEITFQELFSSKKDW